ncbi:MAG: outer membrane protein assembly factor BamB family protein [Ktedonobacteraceae bacterium]
MPEEQESLSLSAETIDNVDNTNNTDDTNDTDDTIKIQRVKLPLNGYNALQIDRIRESENSLVEAPIVNKAITIDENDVAANEPNTTHTAVIENDDANDIPTSISASIQSLPAQPRNLPPPLQSVARLWKFSRMLCMALLLMPIVAVCFFAYTQLNHFQSSLYTVDAHTGTVLAQQPATGAAQTGLVDAQGSVQIVTLANNQQQVVALDVHGAVQWQSFSSDGAFALPPVQSAPGTVLATLSEQTATGYSLTLYSFNRTTGRTNWQYEITQPAQAQSADILSANNNFIYAASTQSLTGPQIQVQLLAINQYTGYIGWRVDGPAEADGNPLDKGTLLLAGHYLAWQVEATIEVIDATQGTILWTAALPFSNLGSRQQEEAQMVVLYGQLVVERNNALHSFDIATGKKLWNVSVFDFATGTIPASIATAGQTILVYGNGQLAAISVSDQQIIWQQRQMGNILGFHVSDDGTLIYVILLDSVENSTPAQALVALDAQNGAARWTFQPTDQFTFLHPQSDGFQYHHTVILTTLCLTANCNHPHLYALNAATGATLWKFEGNSVSNPLMSTDGSIASYEGNTSAWQQFIRGLSG